MIHVYLTQNRVTKIDDRIADEALRYNWSAQKIGNTCYARTRFCKQYCMFMQYLVVGTPISGYVVDHIDGDGLNNLDSNLRVITKRQNSQNLHIKQTSQYPGVCFDKYSGKYRASIRIKAKAKFLGQFKLAKDAYYAYKEAVESIGEFILEEDLVRNGLEL